MVKEEFSKGRTIHTSKASAEKIGESCRISGVKYRIRKVAGGWRVDKQY